MLLLPVVVQLLAALGVHSGLSRSPPRRANFAVLIGKLEGLEQSKGLLHTSSDTRIVDRHVSKNFFVVDQEGSSEGHSLDGIAISVDQNSVVLRDGLGQVRE